MSDKDSNLVLYNVFQRLYWYVAAGLKKRTNQYLFKDWVLILPSFRKAGTCQASIYVYVHKTNQIWFYIIIDSIPLNDNSI